MPAEGCDIANEELWCCVMARQPDHEFMSSYLPPEEGIPDVCYDFFFSEFLILPEYSLFSKEGEEGLLLIAMYHAYSTYHFSCIDSQAIPSVGTFVCPDIRSRRLNPSTSRRTASRGVSFR